MSESIAPYVLSPNIAPLVVRDGRIVYTGQRRKKVAICGSGGWRVMPWDDPSWECWSLNNFWGHAPSADNGRMPSRDSLGRLAASRWFEFHTPKPPIQDYWDMEWLRTCPVPIYVTEPFPENKNAVVWPVEYYVQKYGRRYIPCSFVVQILTAFDEGFEELLVCGLELLRGTQRERTVEASGVAYWLGYVEGRGMKVTIAARPDGEPQHLLLSHPFIYGKEYWEERRWVEGYCKQWNDLPQAI